MSSAAPFPWNLCLSGLAFLVRPDADSLSLPLPPSGAANFLAEISRHFGDYQTDFTLVREFVLIVAAVSALLAAVLLVGGLRQRRERYTPEGWVNDPHVIRELLDAAILQRGRFEMQFHGPAGRRSTYCTAVAVTRSTLTLECSLLRTVPESWKGREVDCYFRTQQKRTQVYYQFASVITGAHHAPSADRYAPRGPDSMADVVWLVDLTLPQKLERRQKRAFLRLDVPRQLVLGLAAWPMGADTPPPADGRRLGTPLLALLDATSLNSFTAHAAASPVDAPHARDAAHDPARDGAHDAAPAEAAAPVSRVGGNDTPPVASCSEPAPHDDIAAPLFPDISRALPVVLLNLSGGGLRLLVPRATARSATARGMNLDIGGRLATLLELYAPQHDRSMGFWLQCRIQNRFVAFETRDVELGLQVLAWGQARDNAPHMADWKPLSDEGEVEPLGNWVIRRHLELYRESGSDVV
uniref:Type IV pilus assembly PilZ n=1 Tax=Nitratidesulfovibrio vulgaris (strain DSM 19637 / Miyazaki F) TaxID=883 RepID=B8DKT0_NITV9